MLVKNYWSDLVYTKERVQKLKKYLIGIFQLGWVCYIRPEILIFWRYPNYVHNDRPQQEDDWGLIKSRIVNGCSGKVEQAMRSAGWDPLIPSAAVSGSRIREIKANSVSLG